MILHHYRWARIASGAEIESPQYSPGMWCLVEVDSEAIRLGLSTYLRMAAIERAAGHREGG